MKADNEINELCDKLDKLRMKLIELEGDDPYDHEEYFLYPPTSSTEISNFESQSKFKYPKSYRSFMQYHNGWLGFWPDWSLTGIPRNDNKKMYEDINNTIRLLPSIVNEKTRAKLSEQEKDDPNVILITNHLVLGTDFNGSLLIFDRNRISTDGEPEIAWVHYGMHVERRWNNFKTLVEDAIRDTKMDIAELLE